MINNASKLVLYADHGEIELPSSCFVVFIDETGHELFQDKKYPLFGLGGCAVQVQYYQQFIELPWQYMKQRWFSGKDTPLHAAELRGTNRPTEEQLQALTHFFTKFDFCRVAALVTDETDLRVECQNYELAATTLINRILEVAKWQNFREVALVFEASERGDRLAEQYFSRFEQVRRSGDGIKFDAPVTKYFAPKGICAGLEVADFVIHTAGTLTRAHLQTGEKIERKDFQAVFRNVDSRLTSFMLITKAVEIKTCDS